MHQRLRTVSPVGAAWLSVVALFVVLRLVAVVQLPVGGAELVHLSGAWQASSAVDDDRYVPTLFQAITALTLKWTESEVPARILALTGTLTIPIALFRLRRPLGDGGALVTLLLLSLDPIGIVLGVTASGAAWDAAITLWLVDTLLAARPALWRWFVIAFLVSTAGPITVPFAAVALVMVAARGGLPKGALLSGGAGALIGVLDSTLRFGLGADGLRIAPLQLFALGFDETWTSATVGEIAGLFCLPLLVGGGAASAWRTARIRSDTRAPTPAEALTIGACSLALLWLIVAVPSNSPFPVGAATLASSLVLGPALARLPGLLATARWSERLWLFVVAIGFASIAVLGLRQFVREGSDPHALGVSLLCGAAALACLMASRLRRLIVLASASVAGGIMLVAAASGVVLDEPGKLLVSPYDPSSARALRDAALETSGGGVIVIHERYRAALTWPFRNSGQLTLASRVPSGAAAVVWPADAAPPDGFVPFDGDWVLVRTVRAPSGVPGDLFWPAKLRAFAEEVELVSLYARLP